MFTTTLFKVLASAGMVSMNGYELEDEDCVPQVALTNVRVELTDGEYTQLEFADQEVMVNEAGEFTAKNTEGEVVTCVATVEKPITEADLLK